MSNIPDGSAGEFRNDDDDVSPVMIPIRGGAFIDETDESAADA